MQNMFYYIGTGLILSAALIAVLSIVFVSWRNGISPMPVSAPVRSRVVAELRRLGRPGTIIEAGSGWGTLAYRAAESNPDSRIIGIENSPIPLAVSRLIARLGSAKNVNFIKGDLYEFPYEQADVVVCYLFPRAMSRLDSVFRERLSSGAVVISVCFALPGWQPEHTLVCRDMYLTKVYVYVRS